MVPSETLVAELRQAEGIFKEDEIAFCAGDLFGRAATALEAQGREIERLRDFSGDAVELAGRILENLGIGQDASKEPGADRLRDRIAAMIERATEAQGRALAEAGAERKRVAAFVRTWLEDWGIDLQQTCDSYRDAAVSGRHNGRKIPADMARKFASEFRERSEAVYPLGELLEKDVLALSPTSEGSGRNPADATPKNCPSSQDQEIAGLREEIEVAIDLLNQYRGAVVEQVIDRLESALSPLDGEA